MPTNLASIDPLVARVMTLISEEDVDGLAQIAADTATPADLWRKTANYGGAANLLNIADGKRRALALIAFLPLCDPNAANGDPFFDDIPFIVAAATGEADALRRLLPRANVNVQTRRGQTALLALIESLGAAADFGGRFDDLLECAQILAPISDLGAKDERGRTAMDFLLAEYNKAYAHRAGLSACADILAPCLKNGEALAVLARAPAGFMPLFAARLEQEALSAEVQGAASLRGGSPAARRARWL